MLSDAYKAQQDTEIGGWLEFLYFHGYRGIRFYNACFLCASVQEMLLGSFSVHCWTVSRLALDCIRDVNTLEVVEQ